MARSVTDVAILLGVLQSPFGEVLGHQLPSDYTQFLDPNALDGAVIGRDVRFFDYSYYGSGIPGDELTVAFAENALSVMESLGATVVDVDTGDVFAYNGDEFTALLYEFRAQIADYLATLTHTEHAHVGRPDCVQRRALCARDALLRPGRILIGGTVPRLSERSRLHRRANACPHCCALWH
jgi:Asp-tRNA(Asn)/Glu-tRNA(Gln) amidotransferase A subunit family amidase